MARASSGQTLRSYAGWRPDSGTKRPSGSGLVTEQSRHEHDPAAAKDAHEPPTRGPVSLVVGGHQRRHLGHVLSGNGLVPGALQCSPTTAVATSDGQPQACGSCGSVIRVRCHGHPARLVALEALLNPGPHAVPTRITGFGGRSVRISHGSLSPSSQQANQGHSSAGLAGKGGPAGPASACPAAAPTGQRAKAACPGGPKRSRPC